MIITILTMFPEYFESFLSAPIPRRAAERGIAGIELVDIKEYAGGCYRHIDDGTYGGGAGMVLRAKPVLGALSAVRSGRYHTALDSWSCGAAGLKGQGEFAGRDECSAGSGNSDLIPRAAAESGTHPDGRSTLVAALTPVGPLYRQETAQRYARLQHLILICGHYEGMDERIYAQVDERVSIGDYVLSGGEPAAQVVADSLLRLLPGVLRPQSTKDESFCDRGLLEYPQYTRPADLGGDQVPAVLLSGNHEEIRKWRLSESLRATLRYRPDLLERIELTPEEQALISQWKSSEDFKTEQPRE